MKFQQLFWAFLCLAGLSMLQSARKSDPCDDTDCKNGGICIDGTCDCPDGYSGPNCEVVDACYEANQNYYTYEGSLTTPPCSEVVNWIVLQTKVQASSAEIKAFVDIMGENYRPVQPLNERTIKFVQQ